MSCTTSGYGPTASCRAGLTKHHPKGASGAISVVFQPRRFGPVIPRDATFLRTHSSVYSRPKPDINYSNGCSNGFRSFSTLTRSACP